MFTQDKLSYSFSDLEPFIDTKTMEIHFTKHHAGYVTKLNDATAPFTEFNSISVEDLISDLPSIPESIRTSVQNNGGGHANHTFFWDIMTKEKGTLPSADLVAAINNKFESIDSFKGAFFDCATQRFGSGWAWLVIKADKTLEIYSTPNQDSPVMQGDTPLIGLDVWEHAYYLNYQNKRADYISAWWNVLNWNKVSEIFTQQSAS